MSNKGLGIAAAVVALGAVAGIAAAKIYSIVKVSVKTADTIDKVSECLTDSLREAHGLPPMFSKEVKGEVIDMKSVDGVYRND